MFTNGHGGSVLPMNTDKLTLRAELLERRKQLSAEDAARYALLITQHIMQALPPSCRAVAGYAATRFEAPVWEALEQLAKRNIATALPCVHSAAGALVFRAWKKGDALQAGAYGISEPSVEAAEVKPDVVLVPLLAFDRKGFRLGYGGGFYDRTLEALRRAGNITAIGIAYSVQEVPGLPACAHDQKMDVIVTEQSVIKP